MVSKASAFLARRASVMLGGRIPGGLDPDNKYTIKSQFRLVIHFDVEEEREAKGTFRGVCTFYYKTTSGLDTPEGALTVDVTEETISKLSTPLVFRSEENRCVSHWLSLLEVTRFGHDTRRLWVGGNPMKGYCWHEPLSVGVK